MHYNLSQGKFAQQLQLGVDSWSSPLLFAEIEKPSNSKRYHCVFEMPDYHAQKWHSFVRNAENRQAVLHPLVHQAAAFANLDVATFVGQLFHNQLGRNHPDTIYEDLASSYVFWLLDAMKEYFEEREKDQGEKWAIEKLIITDQIKRMFAFAEKFDSKIVYYQLYNTVQLLNMIELNIQRILERGFRSTQDVANFVKHSSQVRLKFP